MSSHQIKYYMTVYVINWIRVKENRMYFIKIEIGYVASSLIYKKVSAVPFF